MELEKAPGRPNAQLGGTLRTAEGSRTAGTSDHFQLWQQEGGEPLFADEENGASSHAASVAAEIDVYSLFADEDSPRAPELISTLTIDEKNATRFPDEVAERRLADPTPIPRPLKQPPPQPSGSVPPQPKAVTSAPIRRGRSRRFLSVDRSPSTRIDFTVALAALAATASLLPLATLSVRSPLHQVPAERAEVVSQAPARSTSIGTSGTSGSQPVEEDPVPPADTPATPSATVPPVVDAADEVVDSAGEAPAERPRVTAAPESPRPVASAPESPRPVASAPELPRPVASASAPPPVVAAPPRIPDLAATPAPTALPGVAGPPVVVPEPAPATAKVEAVPPAPAPSANPTPAREPVSENAAVRAALARYERAYSELDVNAVTAVWPTVDRGALRRAFSGLDAQQVRFDQCNVQVSGGTGRATCAGSAMWLPKIGGGKPREQERTWVFVLKNSSGSWEIVEAQVR